MKKNCVNLKMLRILLLFSGLLLSGCAANAPGNLSVDQVIQNIAASMPPLIGMVTAAAYVIGLIFVLRGVYKLKEYGELRTMTSSQTQIMPPVMLMVIGGMLLYFPTTYQVGLMTVFDSSSVLAYSGTSNAQADGLTSAVIEIMQLIGGIAFIRGLMILQKAGEQGQQQATVGKGITHIIGGLLAINAWETWQVLVNTVTGS